MAQVIKRKAADGTFRYDVRTRIGGRVVTRTFKRRRDADGYANTVEADKLRGVVVDPRRAKVTVEEYAKTWIGRRHDLARSTRDLYGYLLDKHIKPALGSTTLSALTPSDVAAWHAAMAQVHPTTAAKAYRLLASVMRTAVGDEVLVRSPCRVKGAATETAPERPVASIAEVQALTDAMPDDQRVAVLLAAWCQLRRGELLGLHRRDIDLLHGTLTVAVTRVRTMGGTMVDKAPKTEAGKRTVAIPPNVVPDLRRHLDAYVGPALDDPVLPRGYKPLRTAWDNARAKVGVPYRLHDLRHAGLTWTATTGATLPELMHRAGHKSPTAALRYQHATRERDRALAAALAALTPKADVVPLDVRSRTAAET